MRDLRNRTSQVVDAVRAGERVVLTVHGEPVADIVPHRQHGLPLVTQDADFDRIAGACPTLSVITV